ncbi:hypothetical protein FZI91_18075 [Mycobacterium sp. CBMA271]|uniref:hypothetical protein n=1 Tax=unclassified Mycobacteroides TaxID=2618759 RepID=UPI0012DC124A|nr:MULTISPECIES: hypothetical protein [unclassified Mycobacteroides]MUM15502.1 hypothetical protein [Mycobacteroides sp. CBMA 326]MUM23591.1 hypothetical protein [Mycobacteroides sp. CBMA 271]
MAAGRRTATIASTSSHAALSLIAGLLYFLFVLPRWPELDGTISHSLGTGLRILTGVLVASAGIPALASWRRTRRPEFATPQLALTLRAASFSGHFLAGALIIATAIAEIWLDLDRFGIWEFGVYGAAAAIGLLAFAAYHLAFVAELPEKERTPRPVKKKPVETVTETAETPAEEPESEESDETDTEQPADETAVDTADAQAGESTAEEPARGLRNRRTRKS